MATPVVCTDGEQYVLPADSDTVIDAITKGSPTTLPAHQGPDIEGWSEAQQRSVLWQVVVSQIVLVATPG